MSAIAFADDIVPVSDTYEGLHTLTVQTERYLLNVALVINPSKSQYFGWRPKHVSKGFDHSIEQVHMAGIEVRPAGRDDLVKYLGLNFCVKKAHTVQLKNAYSQS